MAAPKRTTHQSLHQSLRGHSGIKQELARLEKAANKQLRMAAPRFGYKPGELAEVFLDDLEKVVSPTNWRSPLESSADRLRSAAKRIRQAVRLLVQAADGCPSYDAIPSMVWESSAEADAERQRVASLSFEDRIKSIIERRGKRIIDIRTLSPDFLTAMLKFAARYQREADRLRDILKARNRHFDRLGPLLSLIRDVQSFTGKADDHVVARLLADAHEVSGTGKQPSPDAIRKIRERYLAS